MALMTYCVGACRRQDADLALRRWPVAHFADARVAEQHDAAAAGVVKVWAHIWIDAVAAATLAFEATGAARADDARRRRWR